MASTGLGESYPLTAEKIDEKVEKKRIGVYVLGHMGEKSFIVEYVGRSDDELNGRLHWWIGKGYPRFKFGYNRTVKAAFEKECTIYHDFGGKKKLDNDIHPQRPKGENCPCPVSGCTELTD